MDADAGLERLLRARKSLYTHFNIISLRVCLVLSRHLLNLPVAANRVALRAA